MTSSLAKLLAERCSLDEGVLAEARKIRTEKGGSLGQILLQQDAITEAQLLQALSEQYDIPYWPRLPLDHIESDQTRRAIIDAIVPQLSWPSHADRNKALYALINISKDDRETREYILENARNQIQYIAENSILFNVRDPARELLAEKEE